jgi:uncharacterized protein YcnI
MSKFVRVLGCAAVCAGGVALLAAPASAHVEPDKEEVPAGAETTVGLQVPHGCEDSPTKKLTIQIPEGLVEVTPQVHPGWTIAEKTTKLNPPVTAEDGDEITEGVTEVSFTAQAGNELDPMQRDVFTLGFTAPDKVGQRLAFKTIQTCVEGEVPWIEEWDGTGDEPEHPAPTVTVVKPEGEGGGDAAADSASTGSGDSQQAAASSDSSGDDSSDSTGLAVAGIVIGALGLATAAFAVVRTRKPSGTAG